MSDMQIKVGGFVEGFMPCEGNRVRFVAADGRDLFEVEVGDDGHSITVMGINTCFIGGKVYDTRLQVSPHASNSLTISATEYVK